MEFSRILKFVSFARSYVGKYRINFNKISHVWITKHTSILAAINVRRKFNLRNNGHGGSNNCQGRNTKIVNESLFESSKYTSEQLFRYFFANRTDLTDRLV